MLKIFKLGSSGFVEIVSGNAIVSGVSGALSMISGKASGGTSGVATATINTTTNQIDNIIVTNAGFGYTVAPTVTIGAASSIGSGTFVYGDIITGESSLTTAFVTKWDTETNTLLARNLSGDFAVGEQITNVGFGTAVYTLDSIDYNDDDSYETSDEIQTLTTSSVLDFTEKNPFGEV